MGHRGPENSRRPDFRERLLAAAADRAAMRSSLGKAIAKVIAARPERVAIIASGGMSHFPGTWKYPQPDFEFDYWAIAQMEKGNHEALLSLTSEQLDVVGNTEMLSWMIMFGVIGDQPGELITYQPTWHHGHAVMRFLPDKRTGKLSEEGTKGPATYKFKGSEGYEFYKHPSPSAYKLNKILYDLRFKPSLRVRLINDIPSVAAEYGLPLEESKVLETLQDEDIEKFRNGTVHPLVKAGAHPLGMWMSVIVFHAELRRLRAAAAKGESRKDKRHASRIELSSTGFSLRGLVLASTKPHRLKPVLLILPSIFLITFTSLRRNHAQDARRSSPERQRTVSTGGARNSGTRRGIGAHQGAGLRHLPQR